MAYGQTDDVIEAEKARDEAVEWLLRVAEGRTTLIDVRCWLEKNYPDQCYVKRPGKKKRRKW